MALDVLDDRCEVLVLGIGNILWADEGFGPRCVEHFHRLYEDRPEVRVEDGVATLAGTNVLAGSTMNLMECFLHTVKKARVRMESVVKAVTENPARSLGIFSQYGSIEPGKIAHILILDEDLNLVSVIF